MLSISSETYPLDPSTFFPYEEFQPKQSKAIEAEPPPAANGQIAPLTVTHKAHRIAEYVDPELGQNVDEIREEIRKFGVTRAVTRVDGEVIDGMDVLAACLAEGLAPVFFDVATDRPAELLIRLKVAGAFDEGRCATLVEFLSDPALAVKHGGSRMQEALVPLETMADRARERGAKTTQKKARKLVGCGDIDLVRQVIRGEMTLNAALKLKNPRETKKEGVHHKCKCKIDSLTSRNQRLETDIALLRAQLGPLAAGSSNEEASEHGDPQ